DVVHPTLARRLADRAQLDAPTPPRDPRRAAPRRTAHRVPRAALRAVRAADVAATGSDPRAVRRRVRRRSVRLELHLARLGGQRGTGGAAAGIPAAALRYTPRAPLGKTPPAGGAAPARAAVPATATRIHSTRAPRGVPRLAPPPARRGDARPRPPPLSRPACRRGRFPGDELGGRHHLGCPAVFPVLQPGRDRARLRMSPHGARRSRHEEAAAARVASRRAATQSRATRHGGMGLLRTRGAARVVGGVARDAHNGSAAGMGPQAPGPRWRPWRAAPAGAGRACRVVRGWDTAERPRPALNVPPTRPEIELLLCCARFQTGSEVGDAVRPPSRRGMGWTWLVRQTRWHGVLLPPPRFLPSTPLDGIPPAVL